MKHIRCVTVVMLIITMMLNIIPSSQALKPRYRVGDVNKDWLHNTGDAVMVLRNCSGIGLLDDEALLLADVNRDGEVNSGDAVYILKFCSSSTVVQKPNFGRYRFDEIAFSDGTYGSEKWVANEWYQKVTDEGLYETVMNGSVVYTARTPDELEAFVNPETCRLGGSLRVIPGDGTEDIIGSSVETVDSIAKATEHYDEAFFEENAVCFIIGMEPGAARSVEVSQLVVFDSELRVNVELLYNQICAQIVQEYLLIVEIPVELCENADVVADIAIRVVNSD